MNGSFEVKVKAEVKAESGSSFQQPASSV